MSAQTGKPDTLSDTRLPTDELWAAAVETGERAFDGAIWDVRRESFGLPESPRPMTREFIAHTGAVAIAAVDSHGRLLLIRQYRHPVLAREWEIPAGLLDAPGEEPVAAAARELHEEADLHAANWSVLADMYTTPGSSSETIRIFLATGLSEVPADQRHQRADEELGITRSWVDLAAAREATAQGRILNATTQLAIAHLALIDGDYSRLRPASAPWPALDQVRAHGHARRVG